jgi:hypothetical protein
MRYGPRPQITKGTTVSWGIGLYAAWVFVRGMTHDALPIPLGVAGLLLLALWAVLWWRHRRRGVSVSAGRVWLRRVFRTDSVALEEVAAVDAMPSKPARARRLVLHLEDGRHLPAPLRGYAEGHDDPYGPLDVVTSEQFSLVLNDLQQRVTAATPLDLHVDPRDGVG